MGPHPVLRNEASNYEQIWKQWPKEEGLGTPGPGNWRESRTGAHAPFGVLLRCMAGVRFGGVKNNISYDNIGLEELQRGMLEPVQAHRDYRIRHGELLDLLRRLVFHPTLGCIPTGCTTDPMVPDELHKMFFTPIETYKFHDSIELIEEDTTQKGPIKKEVTAVTSAGGPPGDPLAEGTVGPQQIKVFPEDTEKTRKMWDGFRFCAGNIWLDGDEESGAFSSEGGIATSQRQGAEPNGPFRGAMWAFGDQFLPQAQRRMDPAPTVMMQMKRIRAEKKPKKVAQAAQMQANVSDTALSAEAVLTPLASAQDEERFWLRHTHPLHYK